MGYFISLCIQNGGILYSGLQEQSTLCAMGLVLLLLLEFANRVSSYYCSLALLTLNLIVNVKIRS